MTRIHPASVFHTLDTPYPVQITLEPIDTSHYSWSVRWMFFYMVYKRPIQITAIILFIVILLVTILIVPRHSVSDNPCISYLSDTLASQVSLSCFRYLWGRSCSRPIPDGYDGGWWLRSPNGGRMVPCLAPYTGIQCGAGSYSTIAMYLYRCRINEDGL